jgi:hypothetical protein
MQGNGKAVMHRGYEQKTKSIAYLKNANQNANQKSQITNHSSPSFSRMFFIKLTENTANTMAPMPMQTHINHFCSKNNSRVTSGRFGPRKSVI